LERRLFEGAGTRRALGPVERSDREAEIEEWLDAHGVPDPGAVASVLVDEGLDVAALEAIAAGVPAQALGPAVGWLARAWSVHALSAEIRRGSSRISDIVMSLKTYSFLDQAPVQTVSVGDTLDATLEVLGARFRDGVVVRREFDPSLPNIEAFGADLNQVWTNLLTNAADATQGAGEIRIRTRRDGAGYVAVDIEDNGPGIPDAVLPRIFDPFFTTKPPGRGTGMGLATAFTIVREKHQGAISVESRPGRTVFTVRLPVQRGK
jgi:signal transduction histidine kinase